MARPSHPKKEVEEALLGRKLFRWATGFLSRFHSPENLTA